MRLLIALPVIALLVGCASILSDNVYPVNIASNPDGAYFTVTNRSGAEVRSGTTPQVIELKASSGYFKKESYDIVISKDGYQDYSYTLTSTVDGWYWGNILIGGLIGMLIVDPATGAMYKLPEDVDATLVSAAAQDNGGSIDFMIASVDELTPKQRVQMRPLQ